MEVKVYRTKTIRNGKSWNTMRCEAHPIVICVDGFFCESVLLWNRIEVRYRPLEWSNQWGGRIECVELLDTFDSLEEYERNYHLEKDIPTSKITPCQAWPENPHWI